MAAAVASKRLPCITTFATPKRPSEIFDNQHMFIGSSKITLYHRPLSPATFPTETAR